MSGSDDAEHLHVNPDDVLRAMGRMDSIVSDLGDGLVRTASIVTMTFGESWKGQAAKAYGEFWDEYYESAQRLITEADTIRDLVTQSISGYVRTDGAGEDRMERLRKL